VVQVRVDPAGERGGGSRPSSRTPAVVVRRAPGSVTVTSF
jgi:hypothetical protein